MECIEQFSINNTIGWVWSSKDLTKPFELDHDLLKL